MRTLIHYTIAFVWLINGLFCKVLNMVPRHQQIVARLLGNDHANLLTILIGCGELLMSIWIISRFKPKWCGITQMALVLIMNLLEFFLVPELLLWNRFNLLFALLFCIVLYYHYFRHPDFPKHKKIMYF